MASPAYPTNSLAQSVQPTPTSTSPPIPIEHHPHPCLPAGKRNASNGHEHNPTRARSDDLAIRGLRDVRLSSAGVRKQGDTETGLESMGGSKLSADGSWVGRLGHEEDLW
jgi:hypothetical protein